MTARVGALALVLVAATYAFTPVFSDGSWRFATWGAIVLVMVLAWSTGRLRAPWPVAILVSCVGLVVYASATMLPGAPLLVGTEQLAQLWWLLRDGLAQAQEQPAPTPPLEGLLLLVVAGTWLVGLVAHELQFRLRRPGLALVPAIVLWATPLAVPMERDATWPTALPFLAAAGLVLLLDAHVDLAGTTSEVRERLSPVGAVIGVAALAAGATLAGAVPGYGDVPWWDLQGGGNPRGYQPLVDIGDRLTLPEPRDVLRVRADRKVYLRTAALETFDRTSWRVGPPGANVFRPDPSRMFTVDGTLPTETPIASSETIDVDVTVLDLENIYLPVPYQPREVLEGGDGMVYSSVGGFIATTDTTDNELAGRPAVGVVPGLEYRVRSELPDPDPDALRRVVAEPQAVERFTRLPEPYDDLADVAQRVYVDAGANTAFDQALALQDWFTTSGGFTYSTSDIDRLLGDDALRTFVLDTRVGYCEYFASAMAVMLRATDIPARVATGFAPGRFVPSSPSEGITEDAYVVSTTDAHAWVEVLFPGYGWIRFDPTPRSDGNVIPATGEAVAASETLADQRSALPQGTEDPADPGPDQAGGEQEIPGGLRRDFESSQPSADGAASGVAGWWLPALLVVAAAAVVAAGVGRWRRRTRRPELDPAGRVLASLRRLEVSARRYGLPRRPSETVPEVTERWAREGRIPPDDARRFASLSQAAGFGGHVDDVDGPAAEQLADDLLAHLRRSVSRRDRALAPVRIPAATTRTLAGAALARGQELARGDED